MSKTLAWPPPEAFWTIVARSLGCSLHQFASIRRNCKESVVREVDSTRAEQQLRRTESYRDGSAAVTTTALCPQIVKYSPPTTRRSPSGFQERHRGSAPCDGSEAIFCHSYSATFETAFPVGFFRGLRGVGDENYVAVPTIVKQAGGGANR